MKKFRELPIFDLNVDYQLFDGESHSLEQVIASNSCFKILSEKLSRVLDAETVEFFAELRASSLLNLGDITAKYAGFRDLRAKLIPFHRHYQLDPTRPERPKRLDQPSCADSQTPSLYLGSPTLFSNHQISTKTRRERIYSNTSKPGTPESQNPLLQDSNERGRTPLESDANLGGPSSQRLDSHQLSLLAAG